MATQKAKDTWGMLAGAAPFQAGFIRKNTGKNSLKSQIDALVANRPEYNVAGEYGQNQAIATANAFGRDRSIQQQESNVEQQSANAAGQIGDYSANTGALLDALRGITSDKNAALRNLGADEAAIQQQKLGMKFGADTAMAEEKDKAWNYNVNQPYQTKMNNLVQRRKARQENIWKAVDAALGIGGTMASGGATRIPKPQSAATEYDYSGYAS